MTFGQKLKELRIQAGMTQAQLAEVSDVPLGTIRDYEQGKRVPLLYAAQKLAQALKQSLDVFPLAPPPAKKLAKEAKRTASGTASKNASGKGAAKAQADGRDRKPTRSTVR